MNDQLKQQESQLAAIQQEQSKASSQELDIDAIRQELEKQLSFDGEINTALVATILDKVVVKKESTKEDIHLDVYLKLGQKYEAIYSPLSAPAGINPPIRDKAHRHFLWKTTDEVLFVYYGRTVEICWKLAIKEATARLD